MLWWVQVTAAAEQTFANAGIDATLTASNDAVDAVHTYVVVSIGVNLIASTAATGFALLREHSAINAMTMAQKEAINATCTATLANLAADLIGRNASESLDDPIAIAAAGNNAAQAVKSAWENVNNLRARAAETFAGMEPGGFAMTFAGFTTGMGEWLGCRMAYGMGGWSRSRWWAGNDGRSRFAIPRGLPLVFFPTVRSYSLEDKNGITSRSGNTASFRPGTSRCRDCFDRLADP
jgi:hypothetical protein